MCDPRHPEGRKAANQRVGLTSPMATRRPPLDVRAGGWHQGCAEGTFLKSVASLCAEVLGEVLKLTKSNRLVGRTGPTVLENVSIENPLVHRSIRKLLWWWSGGAVDVRFFAPTTGILR